MVTGSVYVDLSTEPDLFDHRDRRELWKLETVPDGARVVVFIGSRKCVPTEAADYLHRYADRLVIEIQGAPEADVAAWIEGARTGVLGVVA